MKHLRLMKWAESWQCNITLVNYGGAVFTGWVGEIVAGDKDKGDDPGGEKYGAEGCISGRGRELDTITRAPSYLNIYKVPDLCVVKPVSHRPDPVQPDAAQLLPGFSVPLPVACSRVGVWASSSLVTFTDSTSAGPDCLTHSQPGHTLTVFHSFYCALVGGLKQEPNYVSGFWGLLWVGEIVAGHASLKVPLKFFPISSRKFLPPAGIYLWISWFLASVELVSG